MEKFKFEKLVIWQKSMDFGETINTMALGFPDREKFNLASQICRASDSIALNISEGSIGQSNPEQRKFIGYSIRSLAEVVTCLFKAKRRDYIQETKFTALYNEAYHLMNMMNAFRKKHPIDFCHPSFGHPSILKLMNFYSLNKQAPNVSFKDAVIKGIAPDKGLYFPESITPLPISFFEKIGDLSHHEIAFQAIHQFVKADIPDTVLRAILKGVLDFDFPVVQIEENIATLELFHGPTMAFKDVGARFMAQCLGYFSEGKNTEVTVLVATSGDTGGAVANGFLGVDGVKVVILYPSGKVSDIQERQLTTLGQNITALEVEGTFDDCQKMVKTAFLDENLLDAMQLTSANSINVARWLPQLFYFLFAYKQAKSKNKDIVFSIPSGNFGNICAGMVAQKLGMPIKHFVASTNVNDTVPQFMVTKSYDPKPSTATISNAMDVGDPSNFIRIRHLYQDNFEKLAQNLSSYAFTDDETKKAMVEINSTSGYIADPHGAVGYLGLKKYQATHKETYGIFLETAHPVKFLDVVEETLGTSITIPPQIQQVMNKEKKSIRITAYNELKHFLLK